MFVYHMLVYNWILYMYQFVQIKIAPDFDKIYSVK